MSQTALWLVIAAVVLGLIVAGIGFAARQRPRLRPLPPESRDRYARSWPNLETQFLEDPTGAVNEADRIAVLILTERGATIHDERGMPSDLREARESALSDKGEEGTEGMRIAMLHYRHIVEDAVGESRRQPAEKGRSEVAS